MATTAHAEFEPEDELVEDPGGSGGSDRSEDEGDSDEPDTLFVDAATRVSNPSKFDDWYYGIEDKLGQGTVGMGVCLIVFIVILIVAIVWNPI